MGKDYVNAMFESLQSNKRRIDSSELFGLVISFSFNFCHFLLLIVGETREMWES